MNEKQFYNAKESAEVLGVHIRHITTMASNGKIKRIDKGRYDIQSVHEYAKELEERRTIGRVTKWEPPGSFV